MRDPSQKGENELALYLVLFTFATYIVANEIYISKIPCAKILKGSLIVINICESNAKIIYKTDRL